MKRCETCHQPVPAIEILTVQDLINDANDELLDHMNIRKRAEEWAIAAGEPLEIVRQFGTWAVTSYGLECLTERYEIEKDRLDENENEGTLEWLIHLSEKNWVVLADVIPAYQFAMVHHFPGRQFTWTVGAQAVKS